MKTSSVLVVLVMLTLVSGCDSFRQGHSNAVNKLYVDLSMLDNHGLYGPADGLRSLSYEFCIPRDRENLQQVQMIDVKAQVYGRSPGRIGCSQDQWLMVSDTQRPDYRQVLEALNEQDYIDKIVPVWFE
ncbi:hypothetical protein SIN8267_00607 [Sinobacterium norvegicum]|uniref:Lipoprotein n=1 Tax=Sinobacterium norvegicum TaxID=1641715 RepID=A0ABM9AC30_9GAMM|nr:hypothetical protein [Sinobacterium norvegicum]CAH0990515.1 hypothetical protein SIN8267_00607 [Sinobacterium norvegicum]